jgi:hypothetical protein
VTVTAIGGLNATHLVENRRRHSRLIDRVVERGVFDALLFDVHAVRK